MTNKDVFKILLCCYGYDRNILIKTYYGDGGWIGYDIHAEDENGNEYDEVNCEGFLFHIHRILEFMEKIKAKRKTLFWDKPLKLLLDDNERERVISKDDSDKAEAQHWIEVMKPANEWCKENNPCKTCMTKQDYDDAIHYNCWLCHAGGCDIHDKFWREVQDRRNECSKNL